MKPFTRSLMVVLGLLSGAAVIVSAADPPDWAYPATPPGFTPDPDDGAPKRLAGSNRAYTYQQIEDRFAPADWYPDEHPPMPEVPVARGRQPNVWACSWCHLPNGLGHPQSAGLAALPAAYLTQQLADYKSGARKASVGGSIMTVIAKAMTDEEVKAAADYFAALKRTPWISVVEASAAPKTRIIEGNLRIPIDPQQTEPLGQRIVEVPKDPALTRLYDSHAGFVAYVPVGSVRRGEELVKTGIAQAAGGEQGPVRTIPCSTCHGADLRGTASAPGAATPVPALAGRSPTYIVRQLYDMQSGARAGAGATLMTAVVARLTTQDMIDVAAYLASRQP
jgi:cytochrome c553